MYGSSEIGNPLETSGEGKSQFILEQEKAKAERVARRKKEWEKRNMYLVEQQKQFKEVHNLLKDKGHNFLAFGMKLTQPLHEIKSRFINFGLKNFDFGARICTLGLWKNTSSEFATLASKFGWGINKYVVNNIL